MLHACMHACVCAGCACAYVYAHVCMCVQVWRALPAFGPTNTILLDNESRKFKETPDNGIVVS